jgi:hypothetical protein
MATLDAAATVIAKRQPLGEYFASLLRVTVTNAAADDEFITAAKVGLSNIVACFGQTLGDTASDVNLVMNDATGTAAGSEGDDPGAISIEVEVASQILILAIGRP